MYFRRKCRYWAIECGGSLTGHRFALSVVTDLKRFIAASAYVLQRRRSKGSVLAQARVSSPGISARML